MEKVVVCKKFAKCGREGVEYGTACGSSSDK